MGERDRLLDEKGVFAAVNDLLASTSEACIAVAFWGKGTEVALPALVDRHRHRIVCNLESGCCNPSVIRALWQQNNGRVFTNPRLHAKLWIGKDQAIVGSSNASANGLALQGSEQTSWHEMNMRTEDPDLIEQGRSWFESVLASEETRSVTEAMISEAETVHGLRRHSRPIYNGGDPSVLELIAHHPASLSDRDVFVTTYQWRKPDPRVHKKAVEKGQELGVANLESYNGWGYNSDVPLRNAPKVGAQIIDFDASSHGWAVCKVIAIMTETEWPDIPYVLWISSGKELELDGKSYTLGDASAWRSAIRRHRGKTKDWRPSLGAFAAMLHEG